MSSTRRAPKRQRDVRRAENEQRRIARRRSLAILLARALHGVLTPADAALLRTHVEAEIAEGDAARTSERGQQRSMEQHRQRAEAAHVAIVEAEQRARDAETAAAELARAIRLTRDYVGEDLLPATAGWSWYDALRRHAPHELTTRERADTAETLGRPLEAMTREGLPPPQDGTQSGGTRQAGPS